MRQSARIYYPKREINSSPEGPTESSRSLHSFRKDKTRGKLTRVRKTPRIQRLLTLCTSMRVKLCVTGFR